MGSLTFRAEFFNLANHPNFNLPNTHFVPPGNGSVPFTVGSLGVIQSANAYGNRPLRQIKLGLPLHILRGPSAIVQ